MKKEGKIKQSLENFMNCSRSDKWWFNTNYFFAGTVVIIVMCIILYGVIWSNGTPRINTHYQYWDSILKFNGILDGFINSFGHLSWQHVLLNMLCFSVCGLYFERKIGTARWMLFVPTLAFFTASATGLNNLSTGGVGFSGVNYGLYAVLAVDYIFSFRKDKQNKNKLNLILGAVIIVLIYLAMCFNGGINSFGFKWYPYDFFTNMAHYSGFLAGLVLALAFNVSKIQKKDVE